MVYVQEVTGTNMSTGGNLFVFLSFLSFAVLICGFVSVSFCFFVFCCSYILICLWEKVSLSFCHLSFCHFGLLLFLYMDLSKGESVSVFLSFYLLLFLHMDLSIKGNLFDFCLLLFLYIDFSTGGSVFVFLSFAVLIYGFVYVPVDAFVDLLLV